ncbi:MAG: late competence development ComFB family protein [Pseudomonadales bacterium]|nr:late competence development ComFB family protein [Pseudomonadales bacterium]
MIFGQRYSYGVGSELSEIHNYYERLVIDCAKKAIDDTENEPGFFSDIVCVALNHLPPRYVRHDVDASFYLSPQESREIEERVNSAVKKAIDYVRSSMARRSRDSETPE